MTPDLAQKQKKIESRVILIILGILLLLTFLNPKWASGLVLMFIVLTTVYYKRHHKKKE